MNQPAQNSLVIEVKDVIKNFIIGTQEVKILKGVSFSIHQGDFVVIIGPSGCGKSTLLHTILGLETPTRGDIIFLNQNLYQDTSEDFRSEFRKKHIGMVYQQANWVKSLNVVENVAFPLILLGMEKSLAIAQATEALKQVNLQDWATYRPTELSGGQQQRVALARALINNPEVIIADEPTGNLDYKAGLDVMQLFSDFNKNQGKTVIMVTHDLEYVKYAHTAVRMFDGEVIEVASGKDINRIYADLHMKRGASVTESPNDVSTGDEVEMPMAAPEQVKSTDNTVEPSTTVEKIPHTIVFSKKKFRRRKPMQP